MKKCCIALLGLAPIVLSAQEHQGARYGLFIGGAATTGQIGDFYDKPRLDVGAHMVYGMNGGHALRASLHLLGTLESKKTTNGVEYKRYLTGSHMLAEYLYYTGGRVGEGLYLGVGLGVSSERCIVKYSGHEEKPSLTRLVPTVGAGYDITPHSGISLSYVHGAAEPKDPVIRFSQNHPTVGTVSLTYRYTF